MVDSAGFEKRNSLFRQAAVIVAKYLIRQGKHGVSLFIVFPSPLRSPRIPVKVPRIFTTGCSLEIAWACRTSL